MLIKDIPKVALISRYRRGTVNEVYKGIGTAHINLCCNISQEL